MQIQVNAGHHIEAHQALTERVRAAVAAALERVSSHITRIEVHLSDENGNKTGQSDHRCTLEARIEGRPPVAVSHTAANVDLSVSGAGHKLLRLIESQLDRVTAQRRAEVPARRSVDTL